VGGLAGFEPRLCLRRFMRESSQTSPNEEQFPGVSFTITKVERGIRVPLPLPVGPALLPVRSGPVWSRVYARREDRPGDTEVGRVDLYLRPF